jgi:sugar phosphate isomerase/epimerase
MLIGLCASALSAQELLAAAPVDYLEEHVQNFLAPEGPEDAFAERAARAMGARKPVLVANCFLPVELKCVGDAVDLPRICGWADTAFRRAQSAGIDLIVFGSGGARQLPAGLPQARGFTQFVELLRELAPIAGRHAVTLAVEPLNRFDCNFINTLAEGAETVRAVSHERVRLLVDLYHMLRNGEDPAAIVGAGPLVAHAHIAERETRSAPGVKGDDFRPFLRALRAAGYDRRLSFECSWGDLAAELPAAVAEVRSQLADAGYP